MASKKGEEKLGKGGRGPKKIPQAPKHAQETKGEGGFRNRAIEHKR